jgi:hypothetical protein
MTSGQATMFSRGDKRGRFLCYNSCSAHRLPNSDSRLSDKYVFILIVTKNRIRTKSLGVDKAYGTSAVMAGQVRRAVGRNN